VIWITIADWAFADPIALPDGRKLVTPNDAARYIQKLPKATHDLPHWQDAVEHSMRASRDGLSFPQAEAVLFDDPVLRVRPLVESKQATNQRGRCRPSKGRTRPAQRLDPDRRGRVQRDGSSRFDQNGSTGTGYTANRLPLSEHG
jgi:hypothetical protein